MAYSPSEKYPGAVDSDPNYQGGKFRDNNPSTTNNGSPLKAIDRNELLARDEAIMNDAGFEYNGLPDTPQDSQMFRAYKASLGNGANLLSNHNFLIQTPDDSQPLPSSTPTSYPPGHQIFSGVFANETSGITNLTYIDGRVSFSGGDLYFAVPNTGAIARLSSDQLVASVADFDGKPRTRGVSFGLVGDEYRVTVGIDALEDSEANETLLGSVKFEQGDVATGHRVKSLFDIYGHPNMGIFNVKAFGAAGNGVKLDDSSILEAISAMRIAGGGVLDFPNEGSSKYLIGYGFEIDFDNVTIELNGSEIIATTDFYQGVIPPRATNSFIRVGSNSDGDVKISKFVLNGGGGTLNGRFLSQTGSLPGFSGITAQSGSGDVEGERANISGVEVNDLNVNEMGFDGVYINGAKGKMNNIKVKRSRRLNSVVIDTEDFTFNNCDFDYALGLISNSGWGVWNEPNYSWQNIRGLVYNSCRARYNESGGFLPYNAGANNNVDITLNNCIAEYNSWDINTGDYINSPANNNFQVSPSSSHPSFSITFNNPVSIRGATRGFLVQDTGLAPSGSEVNITFNNPVSIEDNGVKGTGANRAAFAVSKQSDHNVRVNNPTIIMNDNYVSGSIAIATVTNAKGVFVKNPTVIGGFQDSEIYSIGGAPADRLDGGKLPCAFDAPSQTPSQLGFSKNLQPIKAPFFDQTSDPSDNLLIGEVAHWRASGFDAHMLLKSIDGLSKYSRWLSKPTLRASAVNTIGSISSGSQSFQDITVAGAALGDIVKWSITESPSALGISAHVDAPGVVRIVAQNNGGAAIAPSGSWVVVVEANE